MEADIGMTGPHARKCWQLPKAGREKKEFSPRASRRSMVLLTP